MTDGEIEVVAKLVRDAYNEAFLEGMKEETSRRGGNPFDASRACRILSIKMAQWIAAGEADAPSLAAARLDGLREGLTKAARDVVVERERQQSVEGWTPEHDDQHKDGEIAGAAACYALTSITHWARQVTIARMWPWASEWWKPKNPRYDLVRAGALILAEIERLDRIAAIDARIKEWE